MSLENKCPYLGECISKTKPECIPDYQTCMVYKFYQEERIGRVERIKRRLNVRRYSLQI